MASKVRILLSGHGRGEVFVDGAKVPFVRAVAVSAEVNCPNEVRLTFAADTIEVEGEFDITSITDATRKVAANG